MLKFWKRSENPDDSFDPASPAVVAPVLTDATAAESRDIQPPRRSWMDRLKSGLAKTGSGISNLFIATKVDEALFEELETALLMADAGVDATAFLIDQLRMRARKEAIDDGRRLKAVLGELLVDLLRPLEKRLDVSRDPAHPDAPVIIMMVGVNGAGKTTSVGKLAKFLQGQGRTVMLAAGDTFRAAAREQLVIWGERNGIAVIAQQSGDPAAVVFDAVASAAARRVDVLIADTAGRLATQLHLMDELKKVKRVIAKAPSAGSTQPREVLLVIDGNTGQNAIAQVRQFDAAVGLTGLIVTKLDGTAKGGVLAAIALVRRGAAPIPVYFIGIGEGLDDLQPFNATQFVSALLGDGDETTRAAP
ncbi:MAG: signal recognition particle-docking protein FtsY [Burkholderiaceae bacterium]